MTHNKRQHPRHLLMLAVAAAVVLFSAEPAYAINAALLEKLFSSCQDAGGAPWVNDSATHYHCFGLSDYFDNQM